MLSLKKNPYVMQMLLLLMTMMMTKQKKKMGMKMTMTMKSKVVMMMMMMMMMMPMTATMTLLLLMMMMMPVVVVVIVVQEEEKERKKDEEHEEGGGVGGRIKPKTGFLSVVAHRNFPDAVCCCGSSLEGPLCSPGMRRHQIKFPLGLLVLRHRHVGRGLCGVRFPHGPKPRVHVRGGRRLLSPGAKGLRLPPQRQRLLLQKPACAQRLELVLQGRLRHGFAPARPVLEPLQLAVLLRPRALRTYNSNAPQ